MHQVANKLSGYQSQQPNKGGNPFLAALSSAKAQSQTENPIQKYRSYLFGLQKIAKEGDVVAWNRALPQVSLFAESAKVSLEEDLMTRVELKKMEMTLLLQAGKKARVQGQALRQQGLEVQAIDAAQGRELLAKAERYLALAEKLHGQLREKTGIET